MSEFPSPHASSTAARIGFWFSLAVIALIVVGAIDYNNTNHNPLAIPSSANTER